MDFDFLYIQIICALLSIALTDNITRFTVPQDRVRMLPIGQPLSFTISSIKSKNLISFEGVHNMTIYLRKSTSGTCCWDAYINVTGRIDSCSNNEITVSRNKFEILVDRYVASETCADDTRLYFIIRSKLCRGQDLKHDTYKRRNMYQPGERTTEQCTSNNRSGKTGVVCSIAGRWRSTGACNLSSSAVVGYSLQTSTSLLPSFTTHLTTPTTVYQTASIFNNINLSTIPISSLEITTVDVSTLSNKTLLGTSEYIASESTSSTSAFLKDLPDILNASSFVQELTEYYSQNYTASSTSIGNGEKETNKTPLTIETSSFVGGQELLSSSVGYYSMTTDLSVSTNNYQLQKTPAILYSNEFSDILNHGQSDLSRSLHTVSRSSIRSSHYSSVFSSVINFSFQVFPIMSTISINGMTTYNTSTEISLIEATSSSSYYHFVRTVEPTLNLSTTTQHNTNSQSNNKDPPNTDIALAVTISLFVLIVSIILFMILRLIWKARKQSGNSENHNRERKFAAISQFTQYGEPFPETTGVTVQNMCYIDLGEVNESNTDDEVSSPCNSEKSSRDGEDNTTGYKRQEMPSDNELKTFTGYNQRRQKQNSLPRHNYNQKVGCCNASRKVTISDEVKHEPGNNGDVYAVSYKRNHSNEFRK